MQRTNDVMEDVGSQKANIIVGQLIDLNPTIGKKLRGVLRSTKIKKRRSNGNVHMTNVEVGVVDAATL